jgi:hypothetical protein
MSKKDAVQLIVFLLILSALLSVLDIEVRRHGILPVVICIVIYLITNIITTLVMKKTKRK